MTLSTAIAARDEGIAAAVSHADAIDHAWSAVAFQYLHKYAREHAAFRAEDCIVAAQEWGLSCPVPKAFGQVFLRAAREGIIRKAGYAPSAKRHCAPVPLWESLIYGRKAA